MEEGTQMRGIPVNDNVDWQDPLVHAFRALDSLQAVEDETESYLDSVGKGIPGYLEEAWDKLEKEIENLYHSFYMS